MAANRRINAAGLARNHFIIKRLPHAMQALEFKALVRPRHHRYSSNRLRIMGGKLRVKTIAPRQHETRAGQIAHIRANLAGEHRKIRITRLLGALDFGVPISALHQAHRQFAPRGYGTLRQPLQRGLGALAVSLHRQTKPVPTLQPQISRKAAKQIQ